MAREPLDLLSGVPGLAEDAYVLDGPRATNGAQGDDQVAEIRRALFDDAQDTRDASGPAREEVPGTGGLGYRGTSALFFGERGHGKSIVVVTIGLAAAAAGEKVLYLDRENGGAWTRDASRGSSTRTKSGATRSGTARSSDVTTRP